MVDLDELDRLHAALPELEPQTQDDGWECVAVICEAPMDSDLDMYDAATNAVAILNAYPALAAEVRALREVAEAARVTVVRACGRMPEETHRLLAALAKVPR